MLSYTSHSVFRLIVATLFLCVLFQNTSLAQISPTATTPIGFAMVSGSTTGGGNAAPTTVTTFAQLKAAAQDKNPRVIIISGTIKTTDGGGSGMEIASNKTIMGKDKNSTIYGGLAIKNVSNVILRNFNMQGIYPNSGPDDAISVRGSHHVWIDHLNIWDSGDGNLDITNASSYVTVSWCKFWYTDKNHGHRLCALIGSGGGDHPEDWGKNKVTYHHNWFDKLVDQRMPRLMYGQAHVFNNYYTCTGNSYCVGVGSYGAILVENNYFKSVKDPHIFMYDVYCHMTARGNTYDNCTGKKDNGAGGSRDVAGQESFDVKAFDKPPYEYSMDKVEDIPAIVSKYAGPYFGASPVNYTLTTTVAQGQGTINPQSGSYENGANVQITATPAEGWLFERWAGDLTGSSNPATVNMTANRTISAYFAQDTRNRYTITKQASPGGSITQTPEGSSLLEGTSVTFTAVPNGGWTFNGWDGDHTGTNAIYGISSLNSNIAISASFMPIEKYVYQAENGVLKDAVLETKNAGFTGEAYVNISAVSGSFIEIPVYVDYEGLKTVTITFSNGSGAARQFSVSINGTQQIASLNFEPTSNWTTWESKPTSLTLPQGVSTVRLATINGQDGPNIDKITIDPAVITLTHLGITDNSFSYHVSSQKSLRVQFPARENLKVSIFSLDGKLVLSKKITSGINTRSAEIPLRDLNSGMYLIKYEYRGEIKSGYINLL